jgi:hypothetical protein
MREITNIISIIKRQASENDVKKITVINGGESNDYHKIKNITN